MSQKNVFITGGAGFIGRWLAKRCLDAGHTVTVYDNFYAGKRENLAEFADRITIQEADILDREALADAMASAEPTTVIHLAAHHFIPFCNDHPDQTLQVNVDGTYNVLEAASNAGAQTAVVASSGAIYPNIDGPIAENLTAAPVDVYGLSKLLAENVCEHFARTTDLDLVAARLFNTYGPYETNPHLIPHILEHLHDGPTVPLGNIHTKRDYIYVEDVARLLLAAAEADLTDFDGYAVTNVGTGHEYSAEEIIETLRDLTDRPIEIKQRATQLRAVDKLHQQADSTRLKALTGTEAQHSLQDGLSKLLEYEFGPSLQEMS